MADQVDIYGPARDVQGRLHDGRTNRNRCRHISGLCVKASARLRALMKCALPLLNSAAASRAVSTFRVWGSWSDRSCHQLDHPSHRAGGFFNLFAGNGMPNFCLRKRPGNKSCVWLVSPLVAYPMGPTRGFAVDATPTQQGPHDPCIFVRHRYRRPVPASTLEQPPYPLAALVRS
jgi:hypothetical protein